MPTTLVLKVHSGVHELSAQAWDAVVADESPFLEWAFLAALETTDCVGHESGWIPQIITAWRGDTLVGLAPFYVKLNSQGEFIFDWAWADAANRAGIRYYPKGIVAVPFTPVTGARLVVHPSEQEPEDVRNALISKAFELENQLGLSSIHFNFLNEVDRKTLNERQLPIRKSLQYHWFNEDFRTFDDFLAQLRSKRRANIRRERRILAENGVTTRVITGDDLRPEDMQRAFEFYASTVDKFYWGRRYLNREFFEELHGSFRHRIHLLVAQQHGDVFAGAFNLIKNDHLYGRYWGASRDVEFTHFEVCMYAPIEWAIQNGIQVFEPGAGGEHKFERGFRATTMFSAHWIADPRLRHAVQDFVDREGEAIEHQVEIMDAQGPFKRGD